MLDNVCYFIFCEIMPRKALFEKAAVIDAALKIIRGGGIGALSARSLAAALGCSVAPIFGLFSDMEEVQAEAINKIKEVYSAYVAEGLKDPIPFKGVGKAYIRFAVEEPNFFKVLFMRDNKNLTTANVLSGVDDNYRAIFDSIVTSYGLSYEASQRLYMHMWIYTHGIAVLCVTGTCTFSGEEVEKMITEACTSIIKSMKSQGE